MCVLEGVSPDTVHTASFGGDVKPSVPGTWVHRLCLLQALVSHHRGKPLKGSQVKGGIAHTYIAIGVNVQAVTDGLWAYQCMTGSHDYMYIVYYDTGSA